MKIRELEFVDSDQRADDEQWRAYMEREDLFLFYAPDIDIIYVLRRAGIETEEK